MHDSDKEILRGRPYGGTAILYIKKKHLSKYVTSISCQSRRISTVKVVMENNFRYVLLSVYLPCDNFCNILDQSYAAEINVMEHIF